METVNKIKKKVTLKDIADSANMSLSTVSMALAGHSNVSLETRRKVNLLSQELGYKRGKKNTEQTSGASARSSSRHFGYMLIGNRLWDEARSILVHSLAEKSTPLGARLEISAVEDASDLGIVADRLLTFARELDGLILSGLINHTLLTQITELGIPCVVIGNSVISEGHDVSSRCRFVSADHVQMGKIATSGLIASGHRRIGFVSEMMPKHLVHSRWLEGYHLAHWNAGLTVDPTLIHIAGKIFAGGEPAAHDFLAMKDPPTAYIVPDVRIAASFLIAMKNHGIEVDRSSIIIGGQLEIAKLYHLDNYPLITVNDLYLAEVSLLHLISLCEQSTSCSEEILIPFSIHNFPKHLSAKNGSV
ncbi:MAG: LacI family transcriptional regulator [Phycisphaerae bacterium]|nr:LacI family transcriptional regulator [Phycisphaerae bacterium]